MAEDKRPDAVAQRHPAPEVQDYDVAASALRNFGPLHNRHTGRLHEERWRRINTGGGTLAPGA